MLEKGTHKYIYCQRDIPKDKWRYGFRSSAKTGCGWIATYNALCMMGYSPEPERIIKFYEKQLPLIHGNTGTTAFAPVLYFRRQGFQVKYTMNYKQFDEIAKNADACLMYYLWHEPWKMGAHFIALHYTVGGFISYNTYRNSKGPNMIGESVEEFVRKKKFFGVFLIGLWDRKNIK